VWYDGGPPVERSVALMEGQHVLELWPYRLRVCTCDARGRPRPMEREVLFSRVARGQQLLEHLARMAKVRVPLRCSQRELRTYAVRKRCT
jgi:hypothetical protein